MRARSLMRSDSFESIRRLKGLESPYIIGLDLPIAEKSIHRYVAGTRATAEFYRIFE